ncbi:MAG: hypothetical protein AAF598_16900 [Bacteroidota bacterium]
MKVKALFVLALIFLIGVHVDSSPESDPLTAPPNQDSSAFDTMMEVITHKRCMNCHPSDDYPRQGEDSHLHLFEVQRGEDGHGLASVECQTCHQKENNNYSGVPGAPHWHLAPKSMGWAGLSKNEVARAMMNPAKNGNRTPSEIEKHLTEDPLVLWVFEPGVNHEGNPREKPPVSKADYIAAVKSWIADGATIPNE